MQTDGVVVSGQIGIGWLNSQITMRPPLAAATSPRLHIFPVAQQTTVCM